MAGRLILQSRCDCLIPGFDDTSGCAAAPCAGSAPCVSCYRTTSACDCTCKTMAFHACAVLGAVEHCNCTDDSNEPGTIITGAWIGFGDAAAGQTLLDEAAITCPGDPHTIWTLFGTTWDFAAHHTSQSMDCPTDTSTLQLIQMNGSDTQTDLAAGATDGGCTTGAVFIPAADLGITTIPVAGGTHTDCTQEGGAEMLVMQVKDACGHLLVLCPFAGPIGAEFSCSIPPNFCCQYNLVQSTTTCDDGGGTAHIIYSWTKGACSCEPVETITVDLGGDTEHTYTLSGASGSFDHEIPCTSPRSVTIRISITYPATGSPGCAHDCAFLNDVSDSTIIL